MISFNKKKMLRFATIQGVFVGLAMYFFNPLIKGNYPNNPDFKYELDSVYVLILYTTGLFVATYIVQWAVYKYQNKNNK